MNQPNEAEHPSGMTWERWNNPFKSAAERELVIKWNKKRDKAERVKNLEEMEDAPF